MDVSNSTGENTGYRVLGSGGAAPRPAKGGIDQGRTVMRRGKPLKVLHTGELKPHTYVTLKVSTQYPCVVEFLRNNEVIAEREVPAGKATTPALADAKASRGEILIALVPNGKGTAEPCVCQKA